MASDVAEHVFRDPITGRECVLRAGIDVDRLRPGLPGLGVLHGECPTIADVSPDLDCFYCQTCRWNGRISGAWAMEMLDGAVSTGEDPTDGGQP